jgi:large conductance mechanosensitive channel
MTNFLNEFKKFIARGSVVDLAVGLVVGSAFQKIISSLVGDIIFPALTPLLNIANFNEWQIGPVLVGNFVKTLVDFLIIAFFIFLVVKFINRFKKKEEETKALEINKQEQLLIEIRDLLKK